jgi:hypothetical protein
MYGIGITSFAGLVHLTAYRPKTMLVLSLVIISGFYVTRVYPTAPANPYTSLTSVWKQARREQVTPDSDRRLSMRPSFHLGMVPPGTLSHTGSCKLHACTPLSVEQKTISDRESIYHTGR